MIRQWMYVHVHTQSPLPSISFPEYSPLKNPLVLDIYKVPDFISILCMTNRQTSIIMS